MSSFASPSPPLSSDIRRLLARVRGRVRGYVWIEGLALAALWLGGAFWVSLALDWLFEPPKAFRVLLLAGLFGGLCWVVYRYLLRRVTVPLSDASMAVLLERRFHHFDDSLLTSVELSGLPEHAATFNSDMLAYTHRLAESGVSGARPAGVFRWRPLARVVLFACALVGSVVAFAVFVPGAFGMWFERSVRFSDQIWPRRTKLSVEGFNSDGVVKVGSGGDYTLIVKAETRWQDPERVVPDAVQVRYVSDEGAHARETMSREGEAIPPRDHFQFYKFTFTGLYSSLRFYAVGGDDRTSEYRIEVVENPAITALKVDCDYPDYFDKVPAKGVSAAGVMPWPQGSTLTLAAHCNKPLQRVTIERLDGQKLVPVAQIDQQTAANRADFSFTIEKLREDTPLLFSLLDMDGIRTREPYRLTLTARPDEPPQVSVRLRGIGQAVTQKARLPAEGEISDDVGLAKVWFEYQVDNAPAEKKPFAVDPKNREKLKVEVKKAESSRDFAGGGAAFGEALDLADMSLKVGQKLAVGVKATDYCNLNGDPNVASGERYLLDIVTPEQLRALLEARELKLRRQFETIIGDMTDIRDSLARIDFKSVEAPPVDPKAKGAEPEDALKRPMSGGMTGAEPDDSAARPVSPDSVRLLRVQRAIANSQRSAHETLSVAADFDDIRDELVNNRVDSEPLLERLSQKIYNPLMAIGKKGLPEFEKRLRTLEKAANDAATGPAALAKAKEQADQVLRDMDLVLKNMLELEDYNQLVEILRNIVEIQERINEQTLQEQKERARKLLEEKP